MKIGYARISTNDQNLDLQLDALTKAGCERIFSDTASGAKTDRPGLRDAIEFAREGDVLVAYRLDRCGRSLKHLIETVTTLESKGIHFISLTEQIDTTTPAGRLLFHLMGSIAQFERDLIRERTLAGLASARARGRQGGRKPKLNKMQIEFAKRLRADPDVVIKDACKSLGVSRATFYAVTSQGVTNAGKKAGGSGA
jgi:DNA invertase Pin-like site-specific DNA recombinase